MGGILRRGRDRLLASLGHRMARILHARNPSYTPRAHIDFDRICQALRPGDVLLVEGNERISGAIKYLTQSTWSHAAFYVGDALPAPVDGSERPRLIEVNMHSGCVASCLGSYRGFNLRICRARSLSAADRAALVAFMTARLGLRYDLRNVFDLMRFFLPLPPLPFHLRRRYLGLGSGDPTRAICSSLIAQAFQSLNYPILPELSASIDDAARREIFHIRHYSLFAPRDFDLSPYFEIVKPALGDDFDFRDMLWD